MLRSSPFLVFYAEFLLLSQFLYGMNLNDSELPQTIQDWNLEQIGFTKVLHFPCKPLIIKVICFYTINNINQNFTKIVIR